MIGITIFKYGRLATVAGQIETEGTQRSKGRASIPLIAALSILLLPAILAPSAPAATSDIIAPQNNPHTPADGWQAGTCTTDVPQCTVDTPDQFFEEASAHPQVGFTQFTVKYTEELLKKEPVGKIGKVRVDLPVGLTVNPQATPQCADIAKPGDCAADAPLSRVGTSAVTLSILGVVTPPAEPLTIVPVYNLVPEEGQPALFGLELAGTPVYLKADVAWESDYHEGFTIDVPEVPIPGAKVLTNRLTFNGRAGDGTFITTPTTCLDPEQSGFEGIYSTWLLAASHEELASPGYTFPQSAEPQFESPLPEGKKPIDCEGVPYEPSLEVDPGQAATDAPSGAVTDVHVPHITGGGERESSQTRRAEVTLPAGMGISPSAANGLLACSEEQFGKGTRNPVACPPASKVGTVAIETPPLPPGSVTGDVYVGQPKSSDPASGDLYRLFVVANSQRFGISARLIGNVKANPQNGRLTTVFDDGRFGRAPLPGLPEVPFTSFKLDFNDGPRAPLTSPPSCGPHKTTTSLTPWTGNPPATPSTEFKLERRTRGRPLRRDPGGPSVHPGLQSRHRQPERRRLQPVPGPHHPRRRPAGAERGDRRPAARADGETRRPQVLPRVCPRRRRRQQRQERGRRLQLSELELCRHRRRPHRQRRAASNRRQGLPCRPIRRGPPVPGGSHPSHGRAFRSRLGRAEGGPRVDRESVQVHAVSDPIPHVFGGALLDISSVDVNLDRRNFSLDGTNCSPMAVGATLRGGGANPADPAVFTAFPASVPYQWNGCQSLDFKPKLKLQLFGATRRAKNPKLKAVLKAHSGDANIRRAVVTLPKGLILDQSNIAKVCTRDPVRGQRLPPELALRLRPRLYAAARQAARRPGAAAVLQQPPARPRRLPAWPDRRRSRGQDRHHQGQDPELLQHRPRRAGEQIRTHGPRRQEGDPDQQPSTSARRRRRARRRSRRSCKASVKLIAQNGKKAEQQAPDGEDCPAARSTRRSTTKK